MLASEMVSFWPRDLAWKERWLNEVFRASRRLTTMLMNCKHRLTIKNLFPRPPIKYKSAGGKVGEERKTNFNKNNGTTSPACLAMVETWSGSLPPITAESTAVRTPCDQKRAFVYLQQSPQTTYVFTCFPTLYL